MQVQYKAIKQEYEDLDGRVKKIGEFMLKLDTAQVEVERQAVMFDLTQWKPTDLRSRTEEHMYQVITRKEYRLMKAFKETETFKTTFGTSSPFEPVFSSDTHRFTLVRDDDLIPPNKPALRRWLVRLDIKDNRVFEPFKLTSVVVVWNSFSNPDEENCGTFVNYPIKSSAIEVKFPAAKRPKPEAIKLSYYRLDTGEPPVKMDRDGLSLSEDGQDLRWEIPSPTLGYHYQVAWAW